MLRGGVGEGDSTARKKDKNMGEGQVVLWNLEKNRFLSYPSSLPSFQPSASGSKRSLGHSLPGPDFRPHRLPPAGGCQAPSPPAPGQPAGRTQGGQHTLPTRPEINISQETELVLSVFTAKDQAGYGGGARLRNPVLGLTASTPTLPRTRCVPLSQSLLFWSLHSKSSRGPDLPRPWPAQCPAPPEFVSFLGVSLRYLMPPPSD